MTWVTRGAYHLTEKSGWGVESIMVSDLPVYRRIATSVTVWIQKGWIRVAWVWNREGTEKFVNGKQHSIWFVPTGMNGLPQNVLLNFRLEFPKSDLTIYLPSGISEIFCLIVSTLGWLMVRPCFLSNIWNFSIFSFLAKSASKMCLTLF